ncbi:MAG: cobyrinate a,c-diamide synthase [Steroidobacteraceae bacterium]|jgi:cobyrinic acid a,c-diamide synthase
MSRPTFIVSAIASGEGKTTATAALARHLMRLGLVVRVFKVGADFLDALILERASGHPVHVLDLWMVGESECRRLLHEASEAADVVLIEGVMGLYDGTPSTADLARRFELPVLAVIDARAMAQTVGAVAAGLRDFGPVELAGVIANGIASEGHEAMIRSALRDVPLIATLRRQSSALAERHLGLTPPAESPELDQRLDELGEAIRVDPQAWRRLAAEQNVRTKESAPRQSPPGGEPFVRSLTGRQIAIAHDAAFAFLYPANLECLGRLGAEIIFFSPLAGDPVPAGAQAIFLPGGYPEMHAESLARARRFHDSIRAAHAAGTPILAECGGMMVLAESIRDMAGRDWPMAGILPGATRMQTRLAGLGLQSWRTRRGEIRGHTFHYSMFETSVCAAARAMSYPRGGEGECIYRLGSLTASYFHAYFPSCPAAIGALFAGEAP